MHTEASEGQSVIDRWDRVFEAISAEPRRQLVVALADAPPDRQIMLPEAAASPRLPVDRERLEVRLRHVHLPLLERHGFVAWTEDPFRASRGPHFEEVAAVFDALHDHAPRLPDQLVSGCDRLERERDVER